MKIYNYDPITFIYTFSENADLDPEETKMQGKNVYLLPSNATFIKPPAAKEDKAIVWNENQWEYVSDYRKNYDKVDSNLNVYDITEIGEIEEGFALVTKELGELIKVNPNDYVFENDSVREKTEQEKEAEQEAEFNKQFFNTTLGYVRRAVTMKDGSVKSFLTDILPMLVVGVPVLVYDRELNQTRVQVTEVFINECKQRLYKDFYGEE